MKAEQACNLPASRPRKLGRDCLICLQPKRMSSEHAIAAQLFQYPDAPRAEVTCADCNRLLGTCEEDFRNDPFVQQAKAALNPVSYRDRNRRGWIINSDIAHNPAKPGHQFLYDADGEVVKVFAPEPTEAAWRAVGKSMLVFISVLVGNRAFDAALDTLRTFVHGGGSAWDAGLRRGPNPKVDRWDDFHSIRASRINDNSFALDLDLFARYSFFTMCGVPLVLPMNAKTIVFKMGVLERRLLVQCYDENRKELPDLRRWWDKPFVFGANFLSKIS